MKDLIKKYENILKNLISKRDTALNTGGIPQAWFYNGKIEIIKDILEDLRRESANTIEFQFLNKPNVSDENITKEIEKTIHNYSTVNKNMEKEVMIDRIEMQKVVELTTTYKSKKTNKEYCIQEYWRQDGRKIGEVGPRIEE